MRRFSQIVDELELLDLPLQGGVLTWSGGWWVKAGFLPFRFENMWLKVDGFKDLLRGWWQGSGRVDIEGLHLQHLNFREAEVLELPFTEEKIHSALMEMNGDKAPGPDRFTVAFWQACWDFVKEEMWICLRSFMIKDPLPKVLDLGDFRPISLLGGLYKLLAKVLANRLKKVLGKVVYVDQNVFVRGKQILDVSPIANEAVDFGGEGGWRRMSPIYFFADDTIIFYEARKEHLTFLSWILDWFEAASGLRINLAKSELIPIGEVEEIEKMAVELGCRMGSLPNVYLGLPLGAHHKAMSMWDEVEERMRRRLALWKRQYISKGGRITLIKSTLASMPIYQLSLFRMPKIVAKRLEKLQRDFLWEGGSLERKIHLINWEVVCTQKEKVGLGIRKIDLLNKVLLGKWIWRFAFEKENLWKKGDWGEVWPRGLWGGGLMKLAGRLEWGNATVNEVWDSSLGQGGWNLKFSRDFNDWELDLIGDLLNMLRGFRISSEEDSVLWKGGGHGTFGVRDAYFLLVAPNAFAFSNKCIWVDKGPLGDRPCLVRGSVDIPRDSQRGVN
ncbi:putative ribonuclease H protein [Vitis vinifera]|uniref:Putative ribonuclease H protein n=1 Tax=Vitis vinifera TaxID=29760 RepID=A0A438KCY1_VITVI|nr:putative ribonuclease H protein [Vitis vinifera]